MFVDIFKTKNKYDVIYADPPWTYDDKCSAGKRGAFYKYDLMTTKEISELPINKITSDNCILFMWVTFPQLFESQKVIKSWGFKYKTVGFVWVKLNKIAKTLFWGMGNWTRSNAEICLIAIKGNPKRIGKGVHSIILSRIRKHSQKPSVVRNKIKQLVGNDVKCIELFARQSVEGFDCWGNDENIKEGNN